MPTQPKKAPSARQRRRVVEKAVESEARKVQSKRTTERQAKRTGGRATSAAEWRKGRAPVFVRLPSGNVCKAINKGMDAFIKGGRIPNALMPIIDEALKKAEGRPTAAQVSAEVLESPELLNSAVEFANMVVCDCVVEPKILPVPMRPANEDAKEVKGVRVGEWEPIPVEERDFTDDLWVDETDLNDRFFILNWVVGGTQDVEQFRQEFADVVDDVHAGAEDEQEA